MPAIKNRLALILLLAFLLVGCGGSSEEPGTTGSTQEVSTEESSTTQPEFPTTQKQATTGGATGTGPSTTVSADNTGPAYGYTYGQASGNRILEGTGDLPDSKPVDVQLDGVPVWIVGVPLEEDTAWVVAMRDGRVRAFRLNAKREVEPVAINPDQLAPGQPPLARSRGSSLELVTLRNPADSELTHPVPFAPDGDGSLLGIGASGRPFLESRDDDSADTEELDVIALPDARFVRGAGGTLAFLSSPTDSYDHGVLGDATEAESITLLRPGEEGNLEAGFIAPASGGVFEQISPLWFEAPGIDGDLLAVTESTPQLATRVSVYSLDGSLVAAGPFIGEPEKWRHLLAAGPFGPDGGIELVDTLTPHIGGTVEFYRPDFGSSTLEIVATVPGYTSHRIDTRNMDTARAGDLDGDGRWELLVPNDSYTELGAIRRTENGAEVVWTLPAGGTIVTNLASATNSNGRAQVAAGREDGVLRIWP